MPRGKLAPGILGTLGPRVPYCEPLALSTGECQARTTQNTPKTPQTGGFIHEAQAPRRSADRPGARGGGATASGIVLPDTAKEKPQKGKVLAVGDGKVSEETGKRTPLDVAEGDEVLYSKYGGTEIKVDGEDLLVLRESDVLAKVES